MTIRAGEWRVVRSVPYEDCEALEAVHLQSSKPCVFLLPFDRPRAARRRSLRTVARCRWAREVAECLRSTFPYGGLRFCPPGIRLLPYQLEPALAVLRHGALRVLVADDVGLGKTVEAGIVIRELARGDSLARMLVLCPAGLRAQWLRELAALFDVRALAADARWLHESSRDLPRDVNPWSLPGAYVASVDFVKRPEALGPLEDVRWDLLVVDEAHSATPGSDRAAAVDALASRSTRVMLLTATPHSGDEEQFSGLCELGGRREPLVIFCRSRDDARLDAPSMRSMPLAVRLSAPEHRMHRLLEAYTSQICGGSGSRAGARGELVATILRKRALSSPVSLARSVRRRLQLVASSPSAPAQLRLPLLSDEGSADEEPGAALGVPVLEDSGAERVALQAIAEAADEAAQHDSKLLALLRLLRRAQQAAIVFSEYRDTAQHLAGVLSSRGHRVLLLHGGLDEEERRRVVEAFGTGNSLLVATDAASEGLNLHHTCRLVVHFELPWTPSRLHQRAGRVNRIGQPRRVHEIALVGSDTAEQLVLAPLLRRAARSGTLSRGVLIAHLTESQVAARVLSGSALDAAPAKPLPPYVHTMNLLAEAEAEAARLAQLRRLDAARIRTGRVPRRLGVIPVRKIGARESFPPAPLLILFRLVLRDSRGVCLEEDLLPVLVEWKPGGGPWPRRSLLLRRQVVTAMAQLQPRIAPVVERQLSARVAAVAPLRRGVLDQLRRRAAAAPARIRLAARELVQASLFDRRALRERERRDRIEHMLLEEQRARGPAAAPDPGAFEQAEDRIRGEYDVRAILVGHLS